MRDGQRILIAIDTNVISHASRYPHATTTTVLRSSVIQLFAPGTCLREIQQGRVSDELNFLTSVGAVTDVPASSNDQEVTNLNPITLSGVPSFEDRSTEFLIEFFRGSAGTNSSPNPSEKLEDFIESTLGAISAETDFREMCGWDDSTIEKVKELTKEIPPPKFPTAHEMNLDLHKAGLGAVRLDSCTPPNVVEKILSSMDAVSRTHLEHLIKPNAPIYRQSLRTAAMALVSLGFSKDKRIAKSCDEKSYKGARSQWHDAEILATCAGCAALVTMDAKFGRLAYAVYEALEIPTEVMHIPPMEFQVGKLRTIGADYWPK